MADQLAPQFTSTYGHPIVKTPNIDALATRGCRFDAAYTSSPLCAPARFSFMAGRETFAIRAYDNAIEFSSSTPTFCHYLRHMGYHTCLSGKMHFVGPDQLHGFSERLTTDIYPADYAWTPNWTNSDERIDAWYHNMSSVHEAGSADMTYQLEYDDEVGFHGIRKIYRYAQTADPTPFALVASFIHPHDPYVARRKWWDMYSADQIDAPRLSANDVIQDPHSARIVSGIQADVNPPSEETVLNARRAYYANTSYFDDWVGQFIDALKITKLIDNTVVVVLSDHGDMLGERGLWYKMNFFEHSARIPLVAAGPGIVNSCIDSVCTSVDLLPTLLDIAEQGSGTRLNFETATDGQSLYPLMAGGEPETNRIAVSQYAAECTANPIVMVRRGEFKYIMSEADPPMLFNLQDDPLEIHNLAGEPQLSEIESSLRSHVNERWNLEQVRADVVSSQQDRFAIHHATADDRQLSWDFQPVNDVAESYIRSHRELDDLAITGRFPLISKPTA